MTECAILSLGRGADVTIQEVESNKELSAFILTRGHMDWSLYDREGHRKYLTNAERRAFESAAVEREPEVYTFCLVLKETGCRLSEALELTPDNIDAQAGVIVFRSLKKRRSDIHRAVPISRTLLSELDRVHRIRKRQNKADKQERLWTWHRMTAHRRVTEVMAAASISGPYATAT